MLNKFVMCRIHDRQTSEFTANDMSYDEGRETTMSCCSQFLHERNSRQYSCCVLGRKSMMLVKDV